MAKKVYVFLAEGFEEIEAITPVDLLRRAGIDVATVAVGVPGMAVEGGHGVTIQADASLSGLDVASLRYDALICPGGMPAAANLAKNSELMELIRQGDRDGALICAICAAPAVTLGIGGAAVLGDREYTCFPGAEKSAGMGIHVEKRVVSTGTLITAVGAGASAEFSEEIIRQLIGAAAAREVHERTIQRD